MMHPVLDTREGKFAIYVLDAHGSLAIHSGQHESRDAAMSALQTQLKTMIQMTRQEIESKERSLRHWQEVQESLMMNLTLRDPI